MEIKNKGSNPRSNKEYDTRPMPPKASGHITHLPPNQSVCAGCGTCELICALVHNGDSGPMHRRIWVKRSPFEGFPFTWTCHQCDAPECYFACPHDALIIDPKTHARYIDEEKCVGCQRCRKACAYDPSRINFDLVGGKALKCDLCKDRPDGKGYACVEFCPQQALIFQTKEED